MRYFLKTLHLISLSIFLGSITTFIFIGEAIPTGDIVALQTSRDLVASGTTFLTLPAFFVTGLTGILMSKKPKSRWLWAKLIGFILLAVNFIAFIYPAIEASVFYLGDPAFGSSSVEYISAMQREAIFGGVNLILILSLIAIAAIKPSFKRKKKITPIQQTPGLNT